MKRFKSAVNKVIQLGIQGLPSPMDALPGGYLYGLDFEYADSQFQLMVECLRVNLLKNMACTLATATPIQKLMADFESHQATELVKALENKQLEILTLHTEFARDVFTYGESPFVHELQALDVPPASLLIIDHADHLFAVHDSTLAVRQAEICQEWCREHHATIVLCFINHPENNYPASYRAMTDYFGGAMRVLGHGTEQLLSVDFLNGLHNPIAGLCVGFGSTSKGQLHITTTQFSQGPRKIVSSVKKHWYSFAVRSVAVKNDTEFSLTTEVVTAGDGDDENVLFFGANLIDLAPRGGAHLENAPSLDKGSLQVATSNISLRWKQARTFIELVEMAKPGKALTILIDYTPDITFAQLVELVYVLRNTVAVTIKVVVREDGTTLRYHGTDLLLRLGVNTVFTSAMSRKRLPLLMDFIRGHAYNPNLHMSLDEVIRHAQPIEVYGFMPLETFVDEVEILLERSNALEISCLFVIFSKDSSERNQLLIDALQPRAQGDLISIAANQVLLFLFSCADHDIKKVMSKMLPAPLNPPIVIEQTLEKNESIDAYLKGLRVEHITPNKADLERAIATPKLVHNSISVPVNEHTVKNVINLPINSVQSLAPVEVKKGMNVSLGHSLKNEKQSIMPQMALFDLKRSHVLQQRNGQTALRTLFSRLR
jgi:hypothetical protein